MLRRKLLEDQKAGLSRILARFWRECRFGLNFPSNFWLGVKLFAGLNFRSKFLIYTFILLSRENNGGARFWMNPHFSTAQLRDDNFVNFLVEV